MEKKLFKKKLTIFIESSLLGNKKKSIRATDELFQDGMIDSMKILDLIAFIEKTLRQKVPEEKMSMEFFGSINTIVNSFS